MLWGRKSWCWKCCDMEQEQAERQHYAHTARKNDEMNPLKEKNINTLFVWHSCSRAYRPLHLKWKVACSWAHRYSQMVQFHRMTSLQFKKRKEKKRNRMIEVKEVCHTWLASTKNRMSCCENIEKPSTSSNVLKKHDLVTTCRILNSIELWKQTLAKLAPGTVINTLLISVFKLEYELPAIPPRLNKEIEKWNSRQNQHSPASCVINCWGINQFNTIHRKMGIIDHSPSHKYRQADLIHQSLKHALITT